MGWLLSFMRERSVCQNANARTWLAALRFMLSQCFWYHSSSGAIFFASLASPCPPCASPVVVVAVAGWSMLHAAPIPQGGHATSSTNFVTIQRMAFFPLTIPLTTGPGTIATAIAIGTNRPEDLDGLFYSSIVWMVVALGVTMTIYHAYTRSSAMARLFGEEGTSVVTRLSAFLLLCIGVQIVITGVVEVARSLTGGSA